MLWLADVFENVKIIWIEYYQLNSANYISCPFLAWDAMLKMIRVEFGLINDVEILDIVERQKRGGLCFVGSKNYVEANNKHVENYDSNKPSKY